ncbi:MAG: hypothetical protein JNM96_05430 [Bacteroidia bacterium]|nr:hypothetical protein [Bacteroidia bacterium]
MGDSRFISSIIEYNHQWLIGNYKNYWDGFFMYPDKEVISYSDNLLGITPFYSIFRFFGCNHLTAYQLILLASHIANYLFAYYCFYKITGSKIGAATGAFIFAFNLSLLNIHNHPQFTFRFAVPFAFLNLYQYYQNFESKYIYKYGLWLAFQFYLGVYLGYFVLIFSVLFFMGYLIIQKNKFSLFFTLKNILNIIGCMILFLSITIPLFYFYYKRNKFSGYYTSYDVVINTIPQLKSYLMPFYSAFSFGFLKSITVKSTFPWFHQIFPGILVYASIVISLWLAISKKNKLVIALLIPLFFFLIFVTNFNGFSFYEYLQYIPGLRALRVVSRFVLVSTFIYGWLIALNVGYVKKTSVKNILLVLLPVLLFFDNYCTVDGFKRFEKQDALNRISLLETKLKESGKLKGGIVFAYIPGEIEESYKIQIDAMQTAVHLKVKTINGYSSSCHGSFGPFWNQHDSLSLMQWCRDFNLNPDSLVIVK